MNNLKDDLIEEIRLYKRFTFLYNILVETTKLYINTVDTSKFLTGKKQNQNLKFCFESNIWGLCKYDIDFLFDKLKHLITHDNELAISLCKETNAFHHQNLEVRYDSKKETKYNAKLFMEIIKDTQKIFSIYEDYFKRQIKCGH